MDIPQYQISVPLDDLVVITLSGTFEERVVSELESDIASQLVSISPGSVNVIVDLSELTGCSMEARKCLTRIHGLIASRARRTAYVSEQARQRGLALWILSVAGDENGKPVTTKEQAKEWFQSTEGRTQEAGRRTRELVDSVSNRPPPRRKKGW